MILSETYLNTFLSLYIQFYKNHAAIPVKT